MTKEELFNENKGIVYYCYSRLFLDDFIKKSKEDLVQEGFLALWKACTCYDPSLNIKISTYMFSVVKHAMCMWIRKNRNYYYNIISLEEPLDNSEDETLTISDTLSYIQDFSNEQDVILEILNCYRNWLIQNRKRSGKNTIDTTVQRASIILKELTSRKTVTTRYIEEEHNINRTIVSKIYAELRECLKCSLTTE